MPVMPLSTSLRKTKPITLKLLCSAVIKIHNLYSNSKLVPYARSRGIYKYVTVNPLSLKVYSNFIQYKILHR